MGVILVFGIEIYLILRDEFKYLLVIFEYLKVFSFFNEIMIICKFYFVYLVNLILIFFLVNIVNEYISKVKEIGVKYIVYSDYEVSFWLGLNCLSNFKNLLFFL